MEKFATLEKNGTNLNETITTAQEPQIVMATILGIIFVLGFLGNLSVFLVVAKTPSLQRINNVLQVSLATSDFLRVIIVLPTFIIFLLTGRKADHVCSVYHGFHISLTVTTVLNLTGIGLERVFIITQPLVYQRLVTPLRMGLVLAGIWGISFLYGFLQILWFQPDITPFNPRPTVCEYRPRIGFAIFDMIMFFVCPLVCLSVSYGRIFCVVRAQIRRINPTISEWTIEREETFSHSQRGSYRSRSRTQSAASLHKHLGRKTLQKRPSNASGKVHPETLLQKESSPTLSTTSGVHQTPQPEPEVTAGDTTSERANLTSGLLRTRSSSNFDKINENPMMESAPSVTSGDDVIKICQSADSARTLQIKPRAASASEADTELTENNGSANLTETNSGLRRVRSESMPPTTVSPRKTEAGPPKPVPSQPLLPVVPSQPAGPQDDTPDKEKEGEDKDGSISVTINAVKTKEEKMRSLRSALRKTLTSNHGNNSHYGNSLRVPVVHVTENYPTLTSNRWVVDAGASKEMTSSHVQQITTMLDEQDLADRKLEEGGGVSKQEGSHRDGEASRTELPEEENQPTGGMESVEIKEERFMPEITFYICSSSDTEDEMIYRPRNRKRLENNTGRRRLDSEPCSDTDHVDMESSSIIEPASIIEHKEPYIKEPAPILEHIEPAIPEQNSPITELSSPVAEPPKSPIYSTHGSATDLYDRSQDNSNSDIRSLSTSTSSPSILSASHMRTEAGTESERVGTTPAWPSMADKDKTDNGSDITSNTVTAEEDNPDMTSNIHHVQVKKRPRSLIQDAPMLARCKTEPVSLAAGTGTDDMTPVDIPRLYTTDNNSETDIAEEYPGVCDGGHGDLAVVLEEDGETGEAEVSDNSAIHKTDTADITSQTEVEISYPAYPKNAESFSILVHATDPENTDCNFISGEVALTETLTGNGNHHSRETAVPVDRVTNEEPTDNGSQNAGLMLTDSRGGLIHLYNRSELNQEDNYNIHSLGVNLRNDTLKVTIDGSGVSNYKTLLNNTDTEDNKEAVSRAEKDIDEEVAPGNVTNAEVTTVTVRNNNDNSASQMRLESVTLQPEPEASEDATLVPPVPFLEVTLNSGVNPGQIAELPVTDNFINRSHSNTNDGLENSGVERETIVEHSVTQHCSSDIQNSPRPAPLTVPHTGSPSPHHDSAPNTEILHQEGSSSSMDRNKQGNTPQETYCRGFPIHRSSDREGISKESLRKKRPAPPPPGQGPQGEGSHGQAPQGQGPEGAETIQPEHSQESRAEEPSQFPIPSSDQPESEYSPKSEGKNTEVLSLRDKELSRDDQAVDRTPRQPQFPMHESDQPEGNPNRERQSRCLPAHVLSDVDLPPEIFDRRASRVSIVITEASSGGSSRRHSLEGPQRLPSESSQQSSGYHSTETSHGETLGTRDTLKDGEEVTFPHSALKRIRSEAGDISSRRRGSVSFRMYTEEVRPVAGEGKRPEEGNGSGGKERVSMEPSEQHTRVWAKQHFNVASGSITDPDAGATSQGHLRPVSSMISSRHKRTGSASTRMSDNKAIRMTLIVLGTLVLTWLPYEITFIMKRSSSNLVAPLVWNITNTLLFLSTFLNPLVYNFYSSEYRRALKRVIQGKEALDEPWP